MVTFQNLSRNLTLILNEIIQNQNVCKLLYHNESDPYSQTDIDDTKSLIKTLIFPYPFDLSAENEVRSELRVYYPNGILQGNQNIGNLKIHFDVVVHKQLWMISGEDYSAIRPYEIMHNLVQQLNGNLIGMVGRIRFDQGFVHLSANEQFDVIRLIASVVTGK